MSILLSASGLEKRFGSRSVLKDINFTLETSQSISVTGPSGCGKSTLLNIVGLLDSPSGGQIKFNGKSYPKINSGAATIMRRQEISYLFQSYALINSLTALENVLIGMKYAKQSTASKKNAAIKMLERLGLGHVANEKVFTLSGGEQQRVSIARSFLKPGRLILADEPTGALDAGLAEVVMSELFALQRESGKSLLIVTHDLAIAKMCDSQLILQA